MMEPLKITEAFKDELEAVQNHMLFLKPDYIYFKISDFTIEEKVEVKNIRRWFMKPVQKTVVNYYLTDITIWGYNPLGRFWGTFREDNKRRMIERLFNFFNLYVLKRDFIDFVVEPMQKLGIVMEIKKEGLE
jgi:hypothetical protein